MFDTYVKCDCNKSKACCQNEILCRTDFSLRLADDRAYWRGFHDAKVQERGRMNYARTPDLQEVLDKMDKALKPVEELREELLN